MVRDAFVWLSAACLAIVVFNASQPEPRVWWPRDAAGTMIFSSMTNSCEVAIFADDSISISFGFPSIAQESITINGAAIVTMGIDDPVGLGNIGKKCQPLFHRLPDRARMAVEKAWKKVEKAPADDLKNKPKQGEA